MRAKLPYTVLAILFSSTLPATATGIETTCCPLSCIDIDMSAVTRTGADGRPLEVSTRSLGRLQVSETAAFGVSHDGKLHVCISFDPFGDPHVKCVQMPPTPLM